MKESKQEIELNHKASDLYKIVLDIEKYPDYIPWCTSIEILKKEESSLKANMVVDYGFFPSQNFISNVDFDLQKLIINTKYIEGPLKNLDTVWKFIDIENNKSKIFFSVKFEFKSFLHQKLAEIFFPLIEKKMIDSFIKRANKI